MERKEHDHEAQGIALGTSHGARSGRSGLRHGRAGGRNSEGRARWQEGRRHHLHEPEPEPEETPSEPNEPQLA